MNEKKLCYSMICTGNSKTIMARTLLFYEILSTLTKNVLEEVYEKKLNVYVPKNLSKYSFSGELFEGRRYPNIYLKFASYELKKFGYTHCVVFDSDFIYGNKNLLKEFKCCEKEFLMLRKKEICCQKYRPGDSSDDSRIYTAGCIGFNIEIDISDDILKLNNGLVEEYALSKYSEKNNIFEIPLGLVANIPNAKKFCIFFHTGSKLYYSALSTSMPEEFLKYKNYLEKININGCMRLF